MSSIIPGIVFFCSFVGYFFPYLQYIPILFSLLYSPLFRFRLFELPFILYIFLFLLYSLLYGPSLELLRIAAFHFGFVPIHQFIRLFRFRINYNRFVFVLSVLILLETILINFFVPAYLLPNYPVLGETQGHFTSSIGFQRPYSFGANASVTSVLFVVFLALSSFRLILTRVFTTLPVFIVSSFSGFIAFIAINLRFYRSNYLKGISIRSVFVFLSFLLFFLFSLFFLRVWISFLSSRFTFDYIYYLIGLKYDTLTSVFSDLTFTQFLFGTPQALRYGGDFSLLNFVLTHGILPTIFFFVYIFSSFSRRNFPLVILLLISTLHYHVLFSTPGQFVLAYLLII